ncbi:hypothetical protein HZH68_011668 [Vespula germanica]|uniref:Uncharacterized protein n=1 Tax=Vespula germanica TaxID=30212 RepID=A0A834JJS3_VESGE|nr:hypothetical protein HZH68_011668 [Vespula germanica]
MLSKNRALVEEEEHRIREIGKSRRGWVCGEIGVAVEDAFRSAQPKAFSYLFHFINLIGFGFIGFGGWSRQTTLCEFSVQRCCYCRRLYLLVCSIGDGVDAASNGGGDGSGGGGGGGACTRR